MPAFTEYTGTALGWIFVIAAGGAIYFYYKNDPRRRAIRARSHRALSAADNISNRRNTATSTSGPPISAQAKTKPTPKKTKPEQSARTYAAPPVVYDDHEEEEDTSWATELANKKKGATLTAVPVHAEHRQKTVRQNNANQVAAEFSGETSTTGADADDDRSSATSPDLTSTDDAVPVVGDIRDMLEPAGNGPSVLRLTESESFLPVKYKPTKKAAEETESKKQRQNKRKADEKKQQQQELEKVRKAQLENQRRTAREARGEPAKNGLGSVPSTNVWTASPKVQQTASATGATLLDTFSDQPASSGAERTGANGSYWQHRDLPSEEEQIRILLEEDESAWKTVSKKNRAVKRKNTEAEDGGAVKPIDSAHEEESSDTSHSLGGTGPINGIHTSDEDAGWTVA